MTRTDNFKLYWVSEDRQSDLMMGEYDTLEKARAGKPAAEQEIIDQGGTKEGLWEVVEYDEAGDIFASHDC